MARGPSVWATRVRPGIDPPPLDHQNEKLLDPVTHTLTGAALAQAGLKQRTALGTATLVIGANLPDVDVLAYAWGGETALWFRRGLTHGLPALLVLPILLAAAMLLWDRKVRRRRSAGPPARPGALLLLAVVAVASHPLLDFLNVYGMRWLAPIRPNWFYGDTLFIIDPWLWAILGAAVWLGRRRPSATRAALAVGGAYILTMAGSNLAARAVIQHSFEAQETRIQSQSLMVAPVPVTPFTRWVVVAGPDGYKVGTFSWLGGRALELRPLPYDRYAPEGAPMHPAVREASARPAARKYLTWARFPYYWINERPDAYVVYFGDARYTLDPERSWAATRVVVAKRPSEP